MNRLIDFKSRFRILKGGKVSLVVSAFLGGAIIASAAPSDGVVTSGTANISQSGNTTNINQSSNKASINWNKFDIASNETVNFNQPNSSSITLNRVVGNEKSVIDGALNANGQVWILNSNGVLFNSTASINTAGILATTSELSDSDFQNGNYNFKNSSKNSVINLGTIEVVNSGYVVLASNEVKNSGTLKAVKGKVHLVGADEYTLNLNGNSLVNLIVSKGVLDSMVENSGTIIADGGEVYLTTNAVNELLKGVVNNTGIIEANSLDGLTGKVELFAHGGIAEVGGTITALDGFVETSGKTVDIKPTVKVKAKEWLIDPTNITITDATAYETSLNAGTNVTIETQASGSEDGDINVNDEIEWSTANTLTLKAHNDININKEITATNDNGKLALHYGQENVNASNDSKYNVNAAINLKAGDNFETKLGSDGTVTSWKVITDLGNEGSITGSDLQGINGNLSGNYVLGANINAISTSTWNSGIGWTPIGTTSTEFSGSIDGLGHSIDSLYINYSSIAINSIGFFGATSTSANINNIGLIGSEIQGYDGKVGALVGKNSGSIYNSFVTGNIKAGTNLGGLVGLNEGTIDKSYSTNSIDGWNRVGGLVGVNNSIITNSYSTSNITANHGQDFIGGLVGLNSGSITNSYSIGNLSTNNSHVGGLVGYNNDGTITNSFWDKETTGQTSSSGSDNSYGKTTTEMQTFSTFADAGWNISGSDGSYPTFSTTGESVWQMIPPIYLNYNLLAVSSEYTYDGNEVTLSSLWNASTIFGADYISWVLGTDYNFIYNTNTTTGFTNAGSYSNIAVDILKSGYTEATSGNTAGSLVINKKAIDLSVTKTYDGNTSFSSGFTLDIDDIVDDDIINISGNATVSSKNVNTYDSFSSNTLVLDNSNYTLTGGVIGATITAREIEVSAIAEDKVYDGTDTAQVTLSEYEGSSISPTGLVEGDDVSFSGISTFSDKNAGEDKTVTVSNLSKTGIDAANYTISNETAQTTATIAKANATVTANSDAKTYNGLTQTVSGFTASGLVNNETTEVLNNVSASKSGLNAGTYTVVASGTDENYNLTFKDGNLTISPKEIIISANDLSKIYGNSDPVLTYVAEGIIGNDVLEGLLKRTSGETVGEYVISANLANQNYSITFNNGIFTIKRNQVLDNTLTTIANTTAVQIPKVNVVAPIVKTSTPVNTTDGTNVNLVSKPSENQITKLVSMSELKSSQDSTNPTESNEIRVPVGGDSIIELVNAGINLPKGVEQEFYVVANDEKIEN
jgi:filamentous hemagglutinin family protein